MVAGDELSKRTKFALIVWLGKNVSGIKRARMGTDKSSVKEVIRVSSIDHDRVSEKSKFIFILSHMLHDVQRIGVVRG